MKSKNTVLTRYFWDKMSTAAQNLQAELNALAQNPAFVAHFIDDVSFVLSTGHAETSAQAADTIEIVADPTVLPTSSPTKATEKQVEQAALIQIDASLVKKEETIQEKVEVSSDYKDKVVIITPSKPSLAEISLLNKILAAVAVQNTSVIYVERTYAARELASFIDAKIILSFGAVSDFTPDHQVRSKTITVIITKSLSELEQDLVSKKKLWEALKGFFK